MSTTPYAFFDVDETLINIKSMFSFQSFYHHRRWGRWGGHLVDWRSRRRRERLISGGADRLGVNTAFFEEFHGRSQADVQSAAIDWFEQVRHSPGFFIQPVLEVLRRHQLEGSVPVFVSGSSVDILQPLADMLRVRHVLANRLEVDGGRYTGRLIPPQTIGVGKQEAIESFLRNHGVDPAVCYAYGDHLSDLPLLEAVGHPTVVAHDKELIAVARDRGWPLLLPQPSS